MPPWPRGERGWAMSIAKANVQRREREGGEGETSGVRFGEQKAKIP